MRSGLQIIFAVDVIHIGPLAIRLLDDPHLQRLDVAAEAVGGLLDLTRLLDPFAHLLRILPVIVLHLLRHELVAPGGVVDGGA